MKVEGSKLALLSKGSNSQIYRYGCVDKGVVLKMVSASCQKESGHLKNEYEILRQLNHENILRVVKYKEGIIINGTGATKLDYLKNVLVVENACHGSLLDFYKKCRPNINEIRWIVAELGEAVRYLHCNYFVHRDLKLENVLVSQNESQIQIKLGDFGFAANTSGSYESSSYKGTQRGYMAPEIHDISKNHSASYDMYKADIFSLGVILFTLVVGRLPFEFALPNNAHYSLIFKGDFESFWKLHHQVLLKAEENGAMIDEFKEIFERMVQANPAKRPTIEELLDSSWLSGKQEIMKSIKKEASLVLN